MNPAETTIRPRPVYLVKGSDPALVGQQAHALINRLVGDADPSLVVEEHGGPGAEGLDLGAVIDACTTPAFLVDRRVVVVRDAGQLGAADAKRLVEYLKDPLPTSSLVLVAGGGALPPTLGKAVKATGEVLDTTVGTGRARSQWLHDQLHGAPVHLDPSAVTLLSTHLGDDMGRLEGLLDSLAAAYGPGAGISAEELTPFLGSAGALAPWDLTDAIDEGRTAVALAVLGRMLSAGDSHPLGVVSVLHNHVRRMLCLDGAEVTSPEAAATLLGIHAFPAKKALAQARRLGTAKIGRAVELIGAADLDLRGMTTLDAEFVLEVLVARLCRLSGAGRA